MLLLLLRVTYSSSTANESKIYDAASDDDEVDGQVETAAATAASGAVCMGANGLKRCLNVCTSCCRGRNMPRGEPMQMRHCG